MPRLPHPPEGPALDALYNNRELVPEHPQIFQRWAADSARVRATQPCVLDIAYGDGPSETLDVFLPAAGGGGPAAAGGAGAPVLFFIHGGWWRALDKADHSCVAPAYTREGALVVVPNYALCPTVSIADIALQMARALAWTWRNAAMHGGDPRRIVVSGHSAGGHLAAMLLCARWPTLAPDLPADLVRDALSVSGVFDLDPISRVSFLKADLKLGPAEVRRLSPAGFAPPAGRLNAVAGALESSEFLRQNRLIRRRWGAARVPVCEAIPGRNHFTVIDMMAEPGSRLHRLACGLLRQSATD
jgi:arylformamidase